MTQHTADLSVTGPVGQPPVQRQPYLVVTNVTKAFGDFTALKGVSLDVREGEFICFLGPSGCGKTTLLRAIAGLDIQSTGTISQGGKDISALPPEERDFGIVFQSYALFPNLTVRQNIAFGLENRGMKRADITSRVNELLELIALEAHGDKYPSQISGGQQQRVALARALAPNPGLILLDEPLSALDAKVRIHLRQELKQLQERLGVTTVMVTHDQDEALSIADRIVVMNVGVVEQVGTPQEIYDSPASQFVADFIGAMNFFEAKIEVGDLARVGDFALALRDPGLPIGADAVVAIRPEDVRLAASDPQADWDRLNRIPVVVGPVEFLGSHIRMSLINPAFGEKPLVAQLPQTLARALQLVPGKAIEVSLPPERLRVYSRTKAAAPAAPAAPSGTTAATGAAHG